jgi:delta 1-pyrroline-5-carboxylate dehydrogenase
MKALKVGDPMALATDVGPIGDGAGAASWKIRCSARWRAARNC